jgi:hypothetical protein
MDSMKRNSFVVTRSLTTSPNKPIAAAKEKDEEQNYNCKFNGDDLS